MRETDSIKLNKNNTYSDRPFILGVAGGSGSGKTYFSQILAKELTRIHGENICEIISQDNFYFDQSQKFDHDGGAVNFDHPESIDFKLLAEDLKILKSGQAVEIPTYDFSTHKRTNKKIKVEPKKIIIVDGILIFYSDIVRSLFDDLIYFETSEDLRFSRRMERDVKERGRTPNGVHEQFYRQVKPMHDLYVEPSKAHAKTIVYDVGFFDQILKMYCDKFSKKNESHL